MPETYLVTGANGHLGFNLVQHLVKHGKQVRAGIRNEDYRSLFSGMDCEVVKADLLDKKTLANAMQGVDVLYQVAAVFKQWVKNPQRDIIEANLTATRNALEAAKAAGVAKVVYVSSVAALDHTRHPFDESTWNSDFSNPYYRSKTESEQLAWELAEQLQLWMVTVLPAMIIGGHCHGRYTPSMEALSSVLNNKFPFDPRFHFNFIDVDDVAKGMVAALNQGRHGERYLLANRDHMSTTEMFELGQKLFPKTKKPPKVPKSFLALIAVLGETLSRFTGKAPLLMRNWIDLYHQADYRCDTTKAEKELGFKPLPPEQALIRAFKSIAQAENGS